jgi:hypothetical protein
MVNDVTELGAQARTNPLLDAFGLDIGAASSESPACPSGRLSMRHACVPLYDCERSDHSAIARSAFFSTLPTEVLGRASRMITRRGCL